MKGKKGSWIFDMFFIFVMLVVLGAALAAVYFKTDISLKFGDLPKTIFNMYHSGEKILFYVDYSAKHSIYQSVYKLGQKGGFYDGSENYLDYTLWQNNCFPNKNSLKNNLGLYLNNYLDYYMSGYSKDDISLPLNNYDFLIKDDKIIGIATKNIELDIKEKQEPTSNGKYSIKPSFNQKLDFDIFQDYEIISDKAKQLKGSCKPAEDAEGCVSKNKNIFNANNLILSDKCETGLKRAFDYFAEQVYLCAHSENDNCMCKFSTSDGEYDLINLEQNKISMVKDDKTLFELDFDVAHEDKSQFRSNKEVILLKIGDKTRTLDKEGNYFFCNTKRKIFRFCVESNKQVYAYSEEDKQTKLRNVQYKFALKFD